MATGGPATPGSEEEKIECFFCSVCRQILTSPKKLPDCGHTFCLKCIQHVASSHKTGSFPCPNPQCRRNVTVPSGGVAVFPDNIDLLHGLLDRVRNKSICPVHPNYDVDMYCSDCKQPMCPKCIVISHKQHNTKELSEAANEPRRQLEEDRGHVEDAVTYTEDKTKAVEEAINSKFSSLMLMAGEYRDGVLASLKSDSLICLPVLNRNVTEDDITKFFQRFFGFVEQVVKKFRCEGIDDDTEVFSLCPLYNGRKVWLSFASRENTGEDKPCKQFNENGKCVATSTDKKGKVSYRTYMPEKPKTLNYNVGIYDKSAKKEMFSLHKKQSGQADIKITTDSESRILFQINVGQHHAFDVDSSQKFFIVVEEVEKANAALRVQRKVRLYRDGQSDAVDTYPPPSVTCQPSDVCFWKQPDGREILVVADEGGDRLHVLDVQDRAFSFKSYLMPGSEHIVHPTALNTDRSGQLWVALKGGYILTLSFED